MDAKQITHGIETRTKSFTINHDQKRVLRSARWHMGSRLLREVSQKEAAAGIGANMTIYALWETGRLRPRFENCVKIAEFYKADGLSLEKLLQVSHPQIYEQMKARSIINPRNQNG